MIKPDVFHRSLCFAGILIAIALAAGTCMFFYHWVRPRPAQQSEKQIRDSIRYFNELKTVHSDSANFFNQEYEKATKKAALLDSLDPDGRAFERAKYRAEWERKNGY